MCQPKFLPETPSASQPESRKRKAPSGSSNRTRVLTLDELQENFHLPINDVASKLGVCVTVLKQQCRELGIVRWPYRKVRKLDNMLAALENSGPTKSRPFALSNGEEARQRKITTVKRTLEELMNDPNSCAHLKLGKVKNALAAAAAARCTSSGASAGSVMGGSVVVEDVKVEDRDEAATKTISVGVGRGDESSVLEAAKALVWGPNAGQPAGSGLRDGGGATGACEEVPESSNVGGFLRLMESTVDGEGSPDGKRSPCQSQGKEGRAKPGSASTPAVDSAADLPLSGSSPPEVVVPFMGSSSTSFSGPSKELSKRYTGSQASSGQESPGKSISCGEVSAERGTTDRGSAPEGKPVLDPAIELDLISRLGDRKLGLQDKVKMVGAKKIELALDVRGDAGHRPQKHSCISTLACNAPSPSPRCRKMTPSKEDGRGAGATSPGMLASTFEDPGIVKPATMPPDSVPGAALVQGSKDTAPPEMPPGCLPCHTPGMPLHPGLALAAHASFMQARVQHGDGRQHNPAEMLALLSMHQNPFWASHFAAAAAQHSALLSTSFAPVYSSLPNPSVSQSGSVPAMGDQSVYSGAFVPHGMGRVALWQ